MKRPGPKHPTWLVFIDAWMMTGLCAACMAIMAWLVFSPGGQQVPSRQVARALTSAEVSEMTGVSKLQHWSRTSPTNLLTAFVGVFGVTSGDSAISQPSPAQSSTKITTPPKVHQKAKTHPKVKHVVTTPVPVTAPLPSERPKISLGWIPSGISATASIHMIQSSPGLNVVSPSWYQLSGSDGSIRSDVQAPVVTWAHQHQVQVWAMVDNQYSSSLAHSLLTNPSAMATFVHQLVDGAVANHLDGINLDFENMQTSDQAAYTRLVGSLHRALNQHGLKLSVDITPDIVFLQDTDVYFHAGLADASDYLIVMAYDEHWRTDKEPGPVADMPWVNTAINDLLNTGVAANKLILGIPFYTYFWHVTTNGSVSAEAYGTADVQGILSSHGASSSFDKRLQLGYAKYPKPDGYEEVWFETLATLNDQLQLVNDVGLSGVAVWSLSFPDAQAWTAIQSALNHG